MEYTLEQRNIITACLNGDLMQIQNAISMKVDLSFNKYQLFTIACAAGRTSIVQYMYGTMLISHDILQKAFQVACLNGHLDIAQWLNSVTEIDYLIDGNYLFVFCCKFGKLNVAQWLAQIEPRVATGATTTSAFKLACENGYLDLAQYLSTTFDIDYRSDRDFSFRQACLNNHRQLAIWLATTYPDINPSSDNNYIFFTLCENGNLDSLLWFMSLYPKLNVDNCIDRVFQNACASGDLQLVNWLTVYFANSMIKCDCNDAMLNAVDSKNIDLVMYLDEHYNIIYSWRKYRMFEIACRNNTTDIIQWIITRCKLSDVETLINISAKYKYTKTLTDIISCFDVTDVDWTNSKIKRDYHQIVMEAICEVRQIDNMRKSAVKN